MVKVLANGDIVPDNDPRARSSPSARSSSNMPERRPPRQGFINHDNEGMPQGQGANVSVFTSVNQRLASAGVPTWRAGPYTVDPVVSLGFLLSLIFMGFKGLVFSFFLFFVAKYSQHGWNTDSNSSSDNNSASRSTIPQTGPGENWPQWPGTGHRLGQ